MRGQTWADEKIHAVLHNFFDKYRLFKANDEWQTLSRYIMAEAFAQIDKEEIDPILSITTKAA